MRKTFTIFLALLFILVISCSKKQETQTPVKKKKIVKEESVEAEEETAVDEEPAAEEEIIAEQEQETEKAEAPEAEETTEEVKEQVAAPTEKSSSEQDGKININTASLTELTSVKGIGPTMAGRIIEYREKNGGFKSIDDLRNVKGIGVKTFDKISPYLKTEGESSSPVEQVKEAAADAVEKTADNTAEAVSGNKININTASLTELTSVKGIGPTMAGRIIEYREKNGDFKSLDDLKNVKGIGAKTFAKLSPHLTVE